MPQKLSAAERTALEMEAGRQAVRLYAVLDKVNAGTEALQKAFPNLLIGSVLNKPYTHVTIKVTRKVDLAPLFDKEVLLDEDIDTRELMFEEVAEDYPSDHLVAQLALIA